jgi:hypothetical protein
MRFRTVATVGALASAGALVWIRPWRSRVAPSTMLDEFLPEYSFRDTIAIEMPAGPRRIFRALRAVTLRDMPLAWMLGRLRYLPGQMRGGVPAGDPDRAFFCLLRNEMRTIVLGERNEELAMGLVGTLHDPFDQQPQQLSGAHAFREFGTPGFEKLAMSVHVLELEPGRSRVVFEHRTQCLGGASRLRFALYWLAIKPMGAFVTYQLLGAVRRLVATEVPETECEPAETAEVHEVVRELADAVA